MRIKTIKLGRYFFDFVSVFFAVVAAFALDNWNDNRKDAMAEEKILMEIKNGLELDLMDMEINKKGHEIGMKSCDFFRKLLSGFPVSQDSTVFSYFYLTTDNLVITNTSGYESLKSKGLEIIKNDSIRSRILAVYENDYQILKKLEENTPMYQSYQNYFSPINEMLADYMIYDQVGYIESFKLPINLSKKEENLFLSYLSRIAISRQIKIIEYARIEDKVKNLLVEIGQELKKE